jgi:hypothetical protein
MTEALWTPVSACSVCGLVIHWQECPTGGWWIHDFHPPDDHDAVGPHVPGDLDFGAARSHPLYDYLCGWYYEDDAAALKLAANLLSEFDVRQL